MDVKHFSVFIETVSHYFETISDRPAKIFAPFLAQEVSPYICDYTGKITISGDYAGSVYVSAPRAMLSKLLIMLGITSDRDRKMADLVGEISNTLAGNARRELGDKFILSTPTVFNDAVALPEALIKQRMVIPVSWQQMKANVILDLAAK